MHIYQVNRSKGEQDMSILKDRVTIYEVAKAANVSLATVSRVINNRGNVTEKTRKRVEETIKRLKYQPSSLAQGLATSKTTNIAVLLPAANYVYVSYILNGAIDVGRIYGYRTTVFTLDNADNEDIVTNIITSHCDGLILFGNCLDASGLERLSNFHIPTVVIGNAEKNDDVGFVEVDYNTEIKRVINEYLHKGIQDIAVLRYKRNNMYFLNNINNAVEEVYNENGLKFNNFIEIDDSYNDLYEMFCKIFKEKKKIHQVYIAPRDSLANAITNAAIDSGVSIPQACEVIGVIATKYSILARPELSSMSVDMYEVGSVAARMLTKMLSGTLDNNVFRLNSAYIKRKSTR